MLTIEAIERAATGAASRTPSGRFRNPVPTRMGARPGQVLDSTSRWIRRRRDRRPRGPYPVDGAAVDLLGSPNIGFGASWMGHASCLLAMDGFTILTDPVWSKRCSPTQLAGPSRFFPAPVGLSEFSGLDVVVVSHDHYDHLDRATVTELDRFGVIFVVPTGVGAHLKRWGIGTDRVVELGWWDSVTLRKNDPDHAALRITAAPARHFSGRKLGDQFRTLWASWSLETTEHRVFFGGDTGFFHGFREIGERLGPFDMSLLPIGAYDRNWPHVHLNPEEAVEAHGLLNGGLFLPIHWGTFRLAFHPWWEPVERLLAYAHTRDTRIVVPRPGAVVGLESPDMVDPWWRMLARRQSFGRAEVEDVKSVG